MTITSLQISNFQSLPNAELELAPGLTVLVGPSSLGKSAVTRALKAAVRNCSASGLVREGATKFTVNVTTADSHTLALTKGAKVSQFYLDGQTYAKAGVKAPEDIEDFWKIPQPDGRELCFASQHDTPFLLAEPASAVAKVLGDLTNASLLMEAVQKANKLRTEALADEKARRREADEAREELLTHRGLSERKAALVEAETLLEAAETAWQRYEHAYGLQDAHLKLSLFVAESATKLTSASDNSALLDTAYAAVRKLCEADELQEIHRTLTGRLSLLQSKLNLLDSELANYDTLRHDLLVAAGTCPVCGSETK